MTCGRVASMAWTFAAHQLTRTLIRALPIILGVLTTRCAPMVPLDVDGRPIPHPLLVGTFEAGVIAVDSTPQGLRFVVEWAVQAREGTLRVVGSLPVVNVGATAISPSRVRTEPPACLAASNEARSGSWGERGAVRVNQPGLGARDGECITVVRAEYFARDVRVADVLSRVTVIHDGQVRAVQFGRR